ncbi:hypothetical protein [Aureimonas sp. AU4]|uniref:hypothetical protein n=1 Tax=Aureimonas sp. AU4 TaxID=1638163 RepID=UPI00078058BC|nr:hypothetical protein [Aureimonas sp. AU4]
MTTGWAGILLLLFFLPLGFIYGRSLAGRLHAEARRARQPAPALMAPKLLLPLLVVLSLGLRFSGQPLEAWEEIASHWRIRWMIDLLWFVGSLAGFLFFLSIPFILGRVFALLALIVGWFTHVRDEPLRFGTSGYKNDDEPDDENVREENFRTASRRGADEENRRDG